MNRLDSGATVNVISDDTVQYQAEVRAFVGEHLLAAAGDFDARERLPGSLVRELGARGYLAVLTPRRWGGQERDMHCFAALSEELGRACSSTRSLITVHCMVSYALSRWGTDAQRERWLPGLSSGASVGAFALSEPEAGSDAGSVQLRLERTPDGFRAWGQKQWISFGQIADVFLVFGSLAGLSVAFLADRRRPGIRVEPITGLLGARASMLARVSFDDYSIDEGELLGREGFGLGAVGLGALNVGRLSVAAGAVGMSQRCAELSLAYANRRVQFGKRLNEHQLIQRLLAEMTTNLTASRLLCHHAARCLQTEPQRAVTELMKAKYFCTRAASEAARDAVQIHGAVGCTEELGLARMYRDAKLMEIIEGSNEVIQALLGSIPPERAPHAEGNGTC